MTRQDQVLVEDVPESVRQAVEADARERDTNRNDVVGQILADHFRMRWEPSGYPYREADGATLWNLRMSGALRSALRRHARERGITQRGTIILILQLHYGLPTTSARKRPSARPIPPEIVEEAAARNEAGESFRSLEERFRARGQPVKRETLKKAVDKLRGVAP